MERRPEECGKFLRSYLRGAGSLLRRFQGAVLLFSQFGQHETELAEFGDCLSGSDSVRSAVRFKDGPERVKAVMAFVDLLFQEFDHCSDPLKKKNVRGTENTSAVEDVKKMAGAKQPGRAWIQTPVCSRTRSTYG